MRSGDGRPDAPDRAPRIVVAPDKFKGSLSSSEAAAAITRGLLRCAPAAVITQYPIADGGDGTVDVVLRSGFTAMSAEVDGPLGDPLTAVYGLRDDCAVIEMASAAGLVLLPGGEPDDRTSRLASTFGVGRLVVDALDHGARRIVIGAGGSASTDGGAGMAAALGVRCTADGTSVVPAGGQSLLALTSVETDALDPRLNSADVVVATDVDNPLLGTAGAAAVYGPQKGATSSTVGMLDRALAHWADLVETAVGHDLRSLPGAGAAGGLGFGAAALLGARITSGIDYLLELGGFADVVDGVDLVIVGEGSLDEQSLRGKGPIGVAATATGHGVRTVAVAGRSGLTDDQARTAGLAAVYSLSDIESDPARSMRHAAELLETVAAQIATDWLTPDPTTR